MKDSAGRFKAFMLDWDGTLIHSLPLKIENAATLFQQRYGADFEAVRQSYARHSGIPRRQLFDRIALDCLGHPLQEREYPELSAAFSAGNRHIIRAQGGLREGALDALARLHEQGCLLFVSTAAAQEEMEALAVHFGVAAYCEGLFGSRPGFAKGPGHVAHVREQYGLDANRLAGVGDDVSDVALAHAAGIRAIGITGTETRDALMQAGADLVIDRLMNLLDYVG